MSYAMYLLKKLWYSEFLKTLSNINIFNIVIYININHVLF